MPTDLITILAQEQFAVRGAILFEFPSGNYGFWEGHGEIVWNGITFRSGAQVFEIDYGQSSIGLDSNEFTLTLRANPEIGLTVPMLNSIEQENYARRRVSLYKFRFATDNMSAPVVTRPRVGYLDYIEHNIDETGYRLIAHCETRAIDYTRRGWANASDAEQKAISANDRILEYAAQAGTTNVDWGRKKASVATVTPPDRPVL